MAAGSISRDELVGQTDEGLLYLLQSRAPEVSDQVNALRQRMLPKRAAEVSAAELGDQDDVAEWVASDSVTKRAAEDAIARELDLPVGSVFIDYPEKKAMFALNILVQRRSGEVLRLGPAGQSGLIGLPSIADELYRTARVLRVFVLHKRVRLPADAILGVAMMKEADVEDRLRDGSSLLS
jgi:hypothetical protein